MTRRELLFAPLIALAFRRVDRVPMMLTPGEAILCGGADVSYENIKAIIDEYHVHHSPALFERLTR